MTRFKGLPHWCMTGTRPAFYDTESATAIEMVAKLYGSYTELVEDYNKYVDEINKAIMDFETGVISDTTTFKETITKIVHDYIKMIDDKVKIQDATIEEAVNYMKTNIIYAITETVNEMKESGELAELVVEGFNDAIARITTLESNLTSVDAKAEQNIDDILDLKGRVKTAENTVSGMESKVNQSTYAVDSLTKEVGNVRSNMNTLSNEVTSVKSTNTNINRNITTLISRVEDVETDIDSLETRVGTLETTGGVSTGGTTVYAQKGFIQATLSNNIDNVGVTAKGVYFDTFKNRGNIFDHVGNGCIKVKSGVAPGTLKIHLHGCISANNSAVKTCYFSIFKNDNQIAAINIGVHSEGTRNSSSIDLIEDYVEGDAFYVTAGTSESEVTINGTYNRTALIIEEI